MTDHIQETVAEFKKCLTQRVYDGGFLADQGVNVDVASDWLAQRLTSTRERAIRGAIDATKKLYLSHGVAPPEADYEGLPDKEEAWIAGRNDTIDDVHAALATLLGPTK